MVAVKKPGARRKRSEQNYRFADHQPDDQAEAATNGHHDDGKALHAHNARVRRRRLTAIGITEYRWLVLDLACRCPIALRNQDRIFSFDKRPFDGHVGDGRCRYPAGCRCVASPIVQGLSC